MPDYYNPHPHAVHLTGPDGSTVVMEAGETKSLPDYFERYRVRNHIALVNDRRTVNVVRPKVAPEVRTAIRRIGSGVIQEHQMVLQQPQVRMVRAAGAIPQTVLPPAPVPTPAATQAPQIQIIRNGQAQTPYQRQQEAVRIPIKSQAPRTPTILGHAPTRQNVVIGQQLAVDAMEKLRELLKQNSFPVSNNIGVGILSFNRFRSLKRLVDSICEYTDLNRTTIFISDDGSTDPETVTYLDMLSKYPNMVVIKDQPRLGVAGNTNRLLRCLARFQYALVLNDDVEIIKEGWDRFYAEGMRATGLHHLCYRQPGIYGAEKGEPTTLGGQQCFRVNERPQGAIMAYSHIAQETIGFLDESFGFYGMEHVDWSTRVAKSGIQPAGFYDLAGSEAFFLLHDEASAVVDREQHFLAAKQHYATIDSPSRTYVEPTSKSEVPSVSYVVPCRGQGRIPSVRTVINNLRAQRYPAIQIILVEHDQDRRLQPESMAPLTYTLVSCRPNAPFNKAKAFNAGVAMVRSPIVILHDADILVQDSYTKAVAESLVAGEACHLGRSVLYTTMDGTYQVNQNAQVLPGVPCDTMVGYFEGGSLACKTHTYWKAGGFNEDFWGYGNEDCEFYGRLAAVTGPGFREDRKFTFLHLWHDRDLGWRDQHDRNKKLYFEVMANSMEKIVENQYSQLIAAGYGDIIRSIFD
jgi:glycosyltransferase involved in cell wall biosynthesis